MSSEITKTRGADGVRLTGRQHCDVRYLACASRALRSRRPQACMETGCPLGAREPRDPVAIRRREVADRWEKAMSYKTHMDGDRESHSGVVPTKRSNAGQGGPKEIVEGRPLTKENAEQLNPCRTQGYPASGSGRAGQAGWTVYVKQPKGTRRCGSPPCCTTSMSICSAAATTT